MRIVSGDLSNKDRSWIELAKKIASSGECKKRHGAVLVKGGRCISLGLNRYRNDQEYFFMAREARSYHAEEACLRGIGDRAEGATIYVARISRAGDEVMSKPCDNCMDIIKRAGIKRVVYTIESDIEL